MTCGYGYMRMPAYIDVLMKWFVFFSRVACICNGCMFTIMLTRYFNWVPHETMQSTGIVEGFLLGIFLNGLLTFWLVLELMKGRFRSSRPQWLFVFNAGCFIFQLYLLLK